MASDQSMENPFLWYFEHGQWLWNQVKGPVAFMNSKSPTLARIQDPNSPSPPPSVSAADQLQYLSGSQLEAGSVAQVSNAHTHPVEQLPFSPSDTSPDTPETGSPGDGSVSSAATYICEICDHPSKRIMEYSRHHTEVHGESRRCPLCTYPWKRPYKIKNHLIEAHKDMIPSEVLKHIETLKGRHVVEVVDSLAFSHR